MPFNKSNKKKEEVVCTTASTRVTHTTHSVQTFQQRSYSVSSTEGTQHRGFPSLSVTSLPGLSTDAKPVVPAPRKVNLNYQSPFRNSPVYNSFSGNKIINRPTIAPSISRPVVEPVAFNSKVNSAKKLVVKKTGKLYDGNDSIPTYKTSSKNRGEVLIINNIMFKGQDERKGAEVDHEQLKDLFKQIGFKVEIKKNLKGKDMKVQLENFSKKSSLKNADISVVIVMSHGNSKMIQAGTEVYGIDDETLYVEDILQFFSGDKCKNMLDKPKIFIFQCCRGENEQEITVQTDSKLNKPKPRPHADMLLAYSTLPGFVSYRSPETGTWYIQTICDVFSQHAHEYHVEELLKIVDVELSKFSNKNTQTSSYESRGFKRCYLHPI